AEDEIAFGAAVDGVSLGTADEDVVSGAAAYRVAAGASVSAIKRFDMGDDPARRRGDEAAVAESDVVAGIAADGVGARAAEQHVVFRSTVDRIARAVFGPDGSDENRGSRIGGENAIRARGLVDAAVIAERDVRAAIAKDRVVAGGERIVCLCDV